jgi:hypothetical protein
MRRMCSNWLTGRRHAPQARGGNRRILQFEPLVERTLMAVDLVIDYRFDQDQGWFVQPERRQAIEAAASALGSYLSDTLAGIDPGEYRRTTGQSVGWTASIKVPSAEQWKETPSAPCTIRILTICTLEATDRAGQMAPSPERALLHDLVVPQNTITIFVGVGRQQVGDLATTYPATMTTSPATGAWADLVRGRGQAGALATPVTDVSPAVVSVSFDPNANWSFDLDSTTSSQPRLYSTALRQFGQALGIGQSAVWDRYVSRTSSPPTFTGPDAVVAQGAAVPLNATATAWSDTIDPASGDNLFSTTLKPGLHAPTAVDLAALDDLGWQLNKNPQGWGTLLTGRLTDSNGGGVSGALVFATCSSMPTSCPSPAVPELLTVSNPDGYYSYRFHPTRLGPQYAATNWGTGTWQMTYTFDGQLMDTLPVSLTNRQASRVNVQRGVPATLAEGAYLRAPNDAIFLGTAANEPLNALQVGSETHVARGIMDPFVILPSPSKVEFLGGDGEDTFGLTLGQTVETSYLLGSQFRFAGGYQPDSASSTLSGDLLKVTGAFLPGDPPVARLYDSLTVHILNGSSFVIPSLNMISHGVESVDLAVKMNTLNLVFDDDRSYSIVFDTVAGSPDQVVMEIDGRRRIQFTLPQQSMTVSSRSGTLDTLIKDFPSTFNLHNNINRHDVNRDGAVTPIDALNVINYINAITMLPAGSTTSNPWLNRATAFVRGYNLDVVNDDFIIPSDVLSIINQLNRAGSTAGGEGEAPLSTVQPTVAWQVRPAAMQPAFGLDAKMTKIPERGLSIQIDPLAQETAAARNTLAWSECPKSAAAHDRGLDELIREDDLQAGVLALPETLIDALVMEDAERL